MMVSSRKRIHSRLIVTTALVGGVLVVVAPAQAQNLPDSTSVTTVTSGTSGGAPGANDPTFTVGANDLRVGLRDNRTIINWTGTGFNVAAGNSVNFKDDRSAVAGLSGLTDNIAVLNRDLTGNVSNIYGSILSDPNVSVYLINANGIVFGGGAVVNTGSFVASTRDVTDANFLAGSSSLAFSGVGTTGITINGGAQFTTTGTGGTSGTKVGDLIFLGGFVNASGTTSSFLASGDVAFIAADDVIVGTSTGSPMSLLIQRGSAVEGAMKLNGTIQGKNVTLALASRSTVTDNILSVSGMVRATGVEVTDRGVVLTANTSTTGVNMAPAGAGDIDTAGGAIAHTGTIQSTKAATLRAISGISAGNIIATDALDVATGGEANLGDGSSGVVRGGTVNVNATTITANGYVQSTVGAIALAGTSGLLRGGIVQSATDATLSTTTGAIQFSQISGRAVSVQTGSAATASITGHLITATGGATLRAGDVTLTGQLRATGGDVVVDAANAVRIDSVTADAGKVTIGQGTTPLVTRIYGAVTASDDILLLGNGVHIGSANSTGARVVALGAEFYADGDVRAAGDITLRTTGSVRAATIASAAGTVALDAGTAVTASAISGRDVNIGQITAPAGLTVSGAITAQDNVRIDAGLTTLGSVTATNNYVDIAAQRLIANGDIQAGTSVTLSSNTTTALQNVRASGGSLTIDSVQAITASSLTALGGAVVVGQLYPAAPVTVSGAVNGALGVTITGGSVSLGSATSGQTIALRSTSGALVTGDVFAGGAVTLNAAGDASFGNLTALTGDVFFNGTGSFVAESINTAGNASVTAVSTAQVRQNVIALGSVALTGTTLDIGSADARGGTATLTATAGDLIVGGLVNATAGISLTAQGNLRVAQAVRTTGGNVAINAPGSVQIDSVLADTGSIAIGNLTAPSFLRVFGNVTAAGTASLRGGAVHVAAVDADGAVTMTATTGGIATDGPVSGASVTMRAQQGIATGSVTADSGDVTIDAGGSFTSQALTAANGSITVGGTLAPLSVTINGAANAGNAVSIKGGTISVISVDAATGAVDLSATNGTLAVNNVDAGTSVTLASGGATTAGVVTADNGDVTISAQGGYSGASISALAGGVTATVPGTLGGFALNAGGITARDSIAVTAGTISLSGASATTGSVALVANGASLTNNGTTSAGTFATLTSQGVTTLVGDVTASNGAVTLAGATSVSFARASGTTTALVAGGAVNGTRVTGGTGATVTGTNGITVGEGVFGGTGAVLVQATAGNVSVGAASGSAVTIETAAGTTTIAGDVTATGGDYVVRGTDVVLGTGTTHLASGAIQIVAGNAIGGAVALLRSNTGDVADAGNSRTILLQAGAGGINLGTSGNIQGGTSRASGVVVSVAPAGPVTLGNVSARFLIGLGGQSSAITLGDVTVDDALTLATSAGDITTGTIFSGGGVILDATAGAVTTGNVTAAGGALGIRAGTSFTGGNLAGLGSVNVSAGGNVLAGTVTSTTGFLLIDSTAGTVTTAALDAHDQVDVDAQGNVSLGTVTSHFGAVDLTSDAGTVATGAIDASTAVRVGAQGNVTIASVQSHLGTVDVASTTGAITVAGDVTGAGVITLTAAEAISADDITGAAILATGRSITAATATANGGDIRLTANNANALLNGDITVGTLNAGGSATLITNGFGNIVTGSLQAAGNVLYDADGAVRADSIISTAGRIDVTASGAITGRAAGGATADRFDTGYGRTLLRSATGVTVTGGSLAQLGQVTRGSGAGHVTADEVNVLSDTVALNSATARTGRLQLVATNGALLLDTGSAGTAAVLDKRAGAGALAVGTLTAGTSGTVSDVTIDSNGAARIDAITTNGAVDIDAAGAMSGRAITAVSDGRTDTGFGRTAIAAGGTVQIDAGGYVQLGALSGGSTAITGTGGAVDIDGAVLVTGDLFASGTSVLLGVSGATRLMSATGGVRLVSTAGGISGGAGLTLTGNSDDTAANAEALTFDATGGGIVFAAGSKVYGGATNRASNVGVRLATPGTALQFGTLEARSLRGVDAAGTTFGVVSTSGNITLGNVSLRNAASITTTGAISLGTIFVTGTGQSLRLDAGTTLTATGVVSSQGDLNLRSGGNMVLTTAVSNAGNATLLSGGTVSGALLQARGFVSETATGADTIATTRSGATGLYAADTDPNPGTGYAIPDPTPAPTAAPTNFDATVRAASITKTSIIAGGALAATATSGQLSIATLAQSGGALTLRKQGATGELIATTVTGGGNTVIDSATSARLGTVSASGTLDIDALGNLTGLATSPGVYGRAVLSSTGALDIDVTGLALLGDVTHGTGTATLDAGVVDVLGLAIDFTSANANTGSLTLVATANGFTLGTGSAATSATLIKQGATGTMAVGSIAAATDVTATSSTGASFGAITATSGDASVTATGAVTITGNVTAGRDYLVTGASVDLGVDADAETQRAARRTAIRATNGAINGGVGLTLSSNTAGTSDAGNTAALTLDATGNILFDLSSSILAGPARQSLIGVNLRTGGSNLALGTVSARGLNAFSSGGAFAAQLATTGNLTIGALTSTDAIDLRTTAGAIRTGSMTSTGGAITLSASGAITGLARGTAATDGRLDTGYDRADLTATTAARSISVTSGALAQLGAVAAGQNVALTAQQIDATSIAAASGALSATAGTGKLIVSGASSAGTTVVFSAKDLLSLGAVTAGSTVALDAANAELTGNVAGTAITIRNTGTGAFALGDGAGAGTFALSQAELNRLNSATIVLDGTGRDINIGTWAMDSDTGTTRIDILTGGDVTVTGTVSGALATRTLRIGGTLNSLDDKADDIRVVATAAADGGGRILIGAGNLDLRAKRIGVGQTGGFLDQSTDALKRMVANSGSPLYRAERGAGATAYSNGKELITANTLTVRYDDYALFQNTGLGAATSGVTIGQKLEFFSTGPSGANSFAMFGTIGSNPKLGGTAAALAGPTILVTGDPTKINIAQSRVNGCIIGGGGGCLVTDLIIPPIFPFDPETANVLDAADDLALAFDPLIGTNNEALFSDFGTIDLFLNDPDQEKREDEEKKADQ